MLDSSLFSLVTPFLPGNSERKIWCSVVLLALVLAGCALAGAQPANTDLPKYAEGMEYYIPTTHGVVPRRHAATVGVTHYFQINTTRICYNFQLPGTWEAGRESAVLRRLDGKGLVGILLFNVAELGAVSMEAAIRKAAERSGELYLKERGGAPWTLTPYPKIAGAWKWTVEGTVSGPSGSVIRIIPRWYLPVGDTWLAQFSIGVPSDVDNDAFVTAVLRNLTTSREPRCYEQRMRELGGIQ